MHNKPLKIKICIQLAKINNLSHKLTYLKKTHTKFYDFFYYYNSLNPDAGTRKSVSYKS